MIQLYFHLRQSGKVTVFGAKENTVGLRIPILDTYNIKSKYRWIIVPKCFPKNEGMKKNRLPSKNITEPN